MSFIYKSIHVYTGCFYKPVKDFKYDLQNSQKFRPFRSIQTYPDLFKPTQIQSKSL